MMGDEERAAELRQLAGNIAPLPWALLVEDESQRNGEEDTRRFLQHAGQVSYEMVGEIWYGDAEARYVLAAVNAAPTLLAERDVALARVAQLEASLVQERAQVIMATRPQWSNATVLAEARAELVAEGLLGE